MPLLYGEGDKAFIRLQEEIIKFSTDHTIFAWFAPRPTTYMGSVLLLYGGLLSPSPEYFGGSSRFKNRHIEDNQSLQP
jgi:hypothetical protein